MPPFDPGLQLERTELAWRRTTLAVTAGLALSGRYVGSGHPMAAVVLPGLAVLVGLVLLRLGTARLRRTGVALRETDRADGTRLNAAGVQPGAGLLAALATVSLLMVVAGAVFVISSWSPLG